MATWWFRVLQGGRASPHRSWDKAWIVFNCWAFFRHLPHVADTHTWPKLFCLSSSWVDLWKLPRLGLFHLPSRSPSLYFLSSYTSHGDSCMDLPFLMHLCEKGFYPFWCRWHLFVEKAWFSLSTSSASFFSRRFTFFELLQWRILHGVVSFSFFFYLWKALSLLELLLWWIILERVVLVSHNLCAQSLISSTLLSWRILPFVSTFCCLK